jgi:hypothetical protein
LADYGFDKDVAQPVLVAEFFANEGFFTEDGILDLVTGNQVMVQGGGDGQPVTLSLPLFRSGDLSEFTPAPALDATFTADGEAEFYRIEVPTAE